MRGKETGLGRLAAKQLCRRVYRQVLPVFDVFTWFLAFARLGAILALFPIFTGNVPVILRISLSALVAFLVLPGLPAVDSTNMGMPALVRLMVIEISVGLLLGFICRLVFYAIELGASVIASEM